MAIITTGQTFTATGPVTNTKLEAIASAATFDEPVDETSLEVKNDGKLGVKDGGVTPAKLSAGGPNWDANGNLLVSNVVAPESANSLTISSDPEAPDPIDGGPQIKLYSKDSGSTTNQIFYRADYHIFNNQNGIQVAAVPPTLAPTQPQHLTRKDYVDGYALTYSGSTGTKSVTTSFVDWDISSVVGVNRAMVIMEMWDPSTNTSLMLRTKGSSINPYTTTSSAGWGAAGAILGTSNEGGTLVVITDASGVIQLKAKTAATGINYKIQAYQKLA